MKLLHRFTLITALSVATWLASAGAGHAQRHFYRAPIVRVNPGASVFGYTVQPYSYRPSGYGLYSGQFLSAIQPNVTAYRAVPIITPGASFGYGYPGNQVYVPSFVYGARTTYVPSATIYRTPRSGFYQGSYLSSPQYRSTRPAFSTNKSTIIPGIPDYKPTGGLPLYRGVKR